VPMSPRRVPRFVAILGDRQSRLAPTWTKETVVAIAAEARFNREPAAHAPAFV
jgi:hypothetical protein